MAGCANNHFITDVSSKEVVEPPVIQNTKPSNQDEEFVGHTRNITCSSCKDGTPCEGGGI